MSYLCCFSKRRTTGLEPEHQLWPINDIPDIAKKGNKTDIQPTDRDFLALQWRRSVTRRCSRLDASNRELLLELSEKDDLHSSIWYLDQEYKDRGLAIGIKHLEPTLQSINSFSDALTCLSQSGPKVTQILWGSFLLLIKLALRHQEILDKITQMLAYITSAMPRFDSYLDLYPTTQLRRALYAIHNDLIEFCLSSAEFLNRNLLANILRLTWSAVDKEFEKIKQNLQTHKEEFEAEAQLANVQATKKWQDEIQEKISQDGSGRAYSRTSSSVHVASTIPFPRNLVFIGREDILQAMANALQLYQVDRPDSLRSVALLGMGGVGKTQLALEYAYRFKMNYSHLFWIKSETEIELRQSLTELVKCLGLTGGGESEEKDLVLAQKWLESSSAPWLLIFDNVQHNSLLKRYWPRSTFGNVIMTLKKSPDSIATVSIPIKPFSPEEGGDLVLSHMHLSNDARPQAEMLSSELGGLPLALVHYIGYCVASHLSLGELISTFQQRAMLAEVWSCNSNESVMQYERTLSTVWDDLLESLDSETRDLLDVLAFLNPDCISEDLLRGKPDTTSGNLTVNNSFRLTVMLSSLIRRNLLERNITTTCPSLRMHRLLQLTLLLNLDRRQEKRQEAFDNAVRLTRDALPRRDMTSRLPQFDAIWKQHMPQVLSLQAAFEQSNLSIAAGFEFASLLADAGSFLWEHRLNRIAIPLLTLGEKIVVAQLQEGETHSVLASIENFLAVLSAYDSVEDRRLAMQRLKRVVQLREGILRSLPDKTATLEQQIDLGRAWNDLAYIHADTEEFEEADQGTAKALELYKSLGDERSLRFRFAIQYQSIAAVRFGQGRLTEALDLSRRSYELCKSELGPRHLETARMEVEWSYVLIGAGDLHGALDRLMDALAVRSERLERDNPAILNTKYWIGTVYHYLDQLEEAEEYLRQAIEFGADSDLGKPDLARSQYRLALLLYEQRRWKEAVTFEEAALSSISDEEQATIFCDGDGRDKRKDITMEVLDRRVFLQNGRSTGPFRGERTGKV